jgi:chemotaxis protein methyltransferase CheR
VMTWSQLALDAVTRFVSHRTGWSFANRLESAELGVKRAMVRAQAANVDCYLDFIMSDSRAFDDLIGELAVGETYFFREPEHFEFIKRKIVPELFQRCGPKHVVRAWSAGTASGEEAYSLAILFEEMGLEHTQLLATDISLTALAKARRGIYSEWSLRGNIGKRALPYAVRTKNAFRLDERIRRRVSFETVNLALDAYPSFAGGIWGMDLVMCRNVLIYFRPDAIREVARRLYRSLAAGGWLITGASDPPLWEDAPFEVVSEEEGVFYRRPLNIDAFSEVSSPVTFAPQAVQEALSEDDVLGAVQMSRACYEDSAAAACHLRALAREDPSQATELCAAAILEFPFAPELHYLYAALLLDLGRDQEAIQAVRRVIYLDRSLAVAHFLLGSLLRKVCNPVAARRAFRNAYALCAARESDDVLPLGEGESAGRLAEAAAGELFLMETPRGVP